MPQSSREVATAFRKQRTKCLPPYWVTCTCEKGLPNRPANGNLESVTWRLFIGSTSLPKDCKDPWAFYSCRLYQPQLDEREMSLPNGLVVNRGSLCNTFGRTIITMISEVGLKLMYLGFRNVWTGCCKLFRWRHWRWSRRSVRRMVMFSFLPLFLCRGHFDTNLFTLAQ